ncbi:tRNA pseudouridine38-40 synthase [Marchantia polymorpha subsp. ruderalis]|uniref:tRNA pseudouridine synthase n=2 Tax=Marchantia polymorpha TaxID=3197 RepID=A0AAF6AVQ6_MARPO|nr:hypothetical protein MARPO_0209s0002 [Marchantia polymorpha]BBN00527.1 hypothetical protein Mp_1g29820 [Marchantia polymorpha subsp. ruderalis]|eukprot:PTQ27269.1 hypothetical protein MARPO_0209s0002 [Marchantia polymorpha]
MEVSACWVTTVSLPIRVNFQGTKRKSTVAIAPSKMNVHVVQSTYHQKPGTKFLSGIKSTASLAGEGNYNRIEDGDIPKVDSWKWSMVVSYDGSKYSGWQIQPKNITVQKTLEDALFQITRCSRENLALTAAGRTDAGVHAWGQVVHFCTPFMLKKLEPLHTSLNSILPQDVRIREIRAVQPEFHARYSALRKTYKYKADLGPVMDPFQRSYAYFFPHVIDMDSMREAASLLTGEHNFSAFANTSLRVLDNPIRNITKFSVESVGPQLIFEVEGTGFFYKQVRNMVGLLLEIGRGTTSVRAVSDVLASQKREKLAEFAPTAPAHGLYLMTVHYDEALFFPPDSIPKTSLGYRQITNQRGMNSFAISVS